MASLEEINLNCFEKIFSLDGKVALVTGGSKGLGLSASSGLLQAGCSTVFVCARNFDDCENACTALNSLPNIREGAKAIPIRVDISKVEEIEAMVEEVSKHTENLDILVANAGAFSFGKLEEYPDSEFANMLNINIKATFNLVQKLTPLIEKNATLSEPSRIIAISSVFGIRVSMTDKIQAYGYAAAKAGVIHMMNNLSIELGPRHILCNCISPGFFPWSKTKEMADSFGGIEAIAKLIPDQRVGTPDDFAATVVYLSSRAGSHVNGINLVVDGGSQWR